MNFPSCQRGSALLIVIIMTSVISILVVSVLRYGATEKRLNHRHALRLEAKAAAEAVVEYGFAELVSRFERRTSFPVDSLAPRSDRSPLVLPASFFDFHEGDAARRSRVVLPSSRPYNPLAPWGSQPTELIGGVMPPGEWRFIDPRVPGNERDRLRGRWVFVRNIRVYGKVTVRDPLRDDVLIAYCQQELQVRDAPLFSHAIFYNMDLEIAPGPAMSITGGVHANGNLYVQSNNSLDFLRNVTTTGLLLHGRAPNSGQSTSYGAVTFPNTHGNQVPMSNGGIWLDSRRTDWADVASNRWHGNVQSVEMHVQPQRLVEIGDYQPDNPATSENELRNSAYQLIMPVLPKSDEHYNPAVEEQKFAYKAGLTARVVPDASEPNGYRIELITYERSSEGAVIYDADTDLPRERVLTPTGSDPVVEVVRQGTTVDPVTGNTVRTGMRDDRRGRNLDLVVVNVANLKAAVEAENGTSNAFGNDSGQRPADWWNGIVYVELPYASTPTRDDGVRPSVDGFGVKLVEGTELPNPAFARSKDTYGMTVATNNTLYVQGHYNADGKSNTGSATAPDSGNVAVEPPAALAADSITFLSSAWNDDRSFSSGVPNSSSFTEVSAALLTGQVVTNNNGNGRYSGGVENFPRFLENWSGRTFRYRGSMVALFQSEIATEPWSGNYYSPPNRDWGFHQLFAQGFYPPGTPNTRTFRRIDFRDLSATAYGVAIAELKAAMNL